MTIQINISDYNDYPNLIYLTTYIEVSWTLEHGLLLKFCVF
jgi:hypothetical protein